ncbi:MAG: DnaB-like helicase C-terminal domain-containing protein, partial [Candidatus Riflebacteria bacterium]
APLPPISPAHSATPNRAQAPGTSINQGGSLSTQQPIAAPPPVAPAVPTFTSNPVQAAASPGFSPNQTTVSAATTPPPTVARPLTKPPMPPTEPSTQTKDDSEDIAVYDSKVTGYGDEDLEISILSGIMKDNYILEALKGKGLIPGLFSTRYSRGIFRSVQALREESPDLTGLDKIVLKNKLKQLNLWDSTVQNFLEKVLREPSPMLDQCLHYLDLMKEQALKRKLKEISHEINEFIDAPPKNENENLESFTNKVIQDVRNIQKARTTKRINLVREEMKEITADMDKREINGEVDIIGYSFEPMHYLNLAVSGFRKGFMYAIAGAPRRGKTTFTLELATRVATLNKIPVLFFTYEQTKKNLAYRLLAKESRLNPDTLQRKKIRSDMIADAKFMGGWKKMQEYMDYFYIIEATKEDTVDRIRSYAYNVMQDFNTENIMIFVDYIQKMPLSRNYNDEKFKVEEISTELKGLSI